MLEGAIDARAFNTVRSSGKSLVIKSSKPDVLKGECCVVTDGKYMKRQHHQFFLLNHGNLNMDGFFFGMESNFSRNLIVRFHVKLQGCFQEGKLYMDIQFLYARNVFFLNHHGMESMQSSKIQSVQNSTNMNIFLSGISNNKGQDSRMLLGCVCVPRKSNCRRSSGHWYRNIPAELAMHFPQAMEILEGDGSDASVSTITMSKEPWASSDVFFLPKNIREPKKGELFWG